MTAERRQSENTALRQLVDALKNAISSRDELWSLSVIDRLFRLDKYKKTIAAYDDAMQGVRNAIQAVMASTRMQAAENAAPPVKEVELKPGISMEEFEFLLGKPGTPQKAPKKAVPHPAQHGAAKRQQPVTPGDAA